MSVTLVQLRRMVRNRIGRSANDAYFDDARVNDAINNAATTFASERDWPWSMSYATISSPVDPGTITLPNDWRSTKALYYLERELDYIPPFELLKYGLDRGEPSVFSHIGTELHVRAVPNAETDFKLLYHRVPVLLDSDSDVLDMPEYCYPAVVAKAAQLCSTREDDRPAAASHLLEYDQWVQRLLMSGLNHKRPVGRRIRSGSWT